MEQRTEGCAEVPTAQEPHEPADLMERDGGEAGNAGKKALRNAVRRALLCGQCRCRANTIPLASVGKIVHKDMIKSLHVSLGSASVGNIAELGPEKNKIEFAQPGHFPIEVCRFGPLPPPTLTHPHTHTHTTFLDVRDALHPCMRVAEPEANMKWAVTLMM